MNKDEIVSKTWLSPREAELYMKMDEGFSVRKAGEKIGMSEGQATSTSSVINDKLEKSKRTIELSDSD